MGNAGAIGSGVCCLIVSALIVIISIIIASIHDVNFDEYGIKYNKLTKIVKTTEVFEEGRHTIGPSSKFFLYKRTLQTLELNGTDSIECLTNEGLVMTLDVTTQYQLRRDDLFDVLNYWGEEEIHRAYLTSLTRDTIKDVCGEFSGEDFFFRRGDIELRLRGALETVYADSNAYADSQLVQLRGVAHPVSYELLNQEKQQVEQEKARVLSERDEIITIAKTRLLTETAEEKIKLTKAQGEADALISEAEELKGATLAKWEERATAFAVVYSQFQNITTSEFINQYVRYFALTSQINPIVSLN